MHGKNSEGIENQVVGRVSGNAVKLKKRRSAKLSVWRYRGLRQTESLALLICYFSLNLTALRVSGATPTL